MSKQAYTTITRSYGDLEVNHTFSEDGINRAHFPGCLLMEVWLDLGKQLEQKVKEQEAQCKKSSV